MSAMPTFDRRLTPARPEVAAASLRGQVDAQRFVEGVQRSIVAPFVPLRSQPRPDVGMDTELLHGETFTLLDQDPEGWSWGQAEDGYVGWLPSHALGVVEPEPATHKVAVLRSFVFPGPSIKLPTAVALPFGAALVVRRVEGAFAVIDQGFVWAGHLRPAAEREPDFVAVAERFIGIPYVWGGKTSLGLDCSGLVQTALAAAGVAAPRDTDLQERALGAPIDPAGPLRRGDLVFWRGHVGIMRDAATLLHANGHSMTVLSEPFAQARARILASGQEVSSIRRL
jgi:cell wall-associated NlpC family hydrolase